ncbi:hypothetical protein BDW42DRAFT_2632 [Aspergillus taichungensis]|uniref:HMG box domain-containing protein n=1 Tax=Aspergillus taichungensis TaxID=482145 RepID=A0A2J5I5X2_9EURO|nr:hypothetical protein BDW42DRAFT_2632 [Aspergillus taichungensis]
MTLRHLQRQPLSPPQSGDESLALESSQKSCGSTHTMYDQSDVFMFAGAQGNLDANCPQPVPRSSPSSHTITNGDYPRSLPVQLQMQPNGFQINTPPSDEVSIAGSLDSAPSHWSSPSQRLRAQGTPKSKLSRASRSSKSPKVRHKRSKTDPPVINAPLSELTKDMSHIPIRDMEEWVHRPIETRLNQTTRKGKVARPMNSFILYRSAYAERTKEWLSQNNHQEVSKVAGQSWKMEPRDIKQKYASLANIEKANHEKAHPGYKYSPKDKSKPTKKPGKTSPGMSHDDTPSSSPSLSSSQTMLSSDIDSGMWHSRCGTPMNIVEHHGLPTPMQFLNSGWPAHHPPRPASTMMSAPEASHYGHPGMHHSLMSAQQDDGRFRTIDMSELQYNTSNTLSGLPGAVHHDLLQPQATAPPPGAPPTSQLDPQLLKYNDLVPAGHVYSGPQYGIWADPAPNAGYLPNAPNSLGSNAVSYHSHSSYDSLDDGEPWDSKFVLNSPTGEFDCWVNPQA